MCVGRRSDELVEIYQTGWIIHKRERTQFKLVWIQIRWWTDPCYYFRIKRCRPGYQKPAKGCCYEKKARGRGMVRGGEVGGRSWRGEVNSNKRKTIQLENGTWHRIGRKIFYIVLYCHHFTWYFNINMVISFVRWATTRIFGSSSSSSSLQ